MVNLYSRFLLPRLLDWVMSDETMARHRRDLLAQVRGETLEIGFGTGLNLPYYPAEVRRLTTVDVNPGMRAIADQRIQASGITVNHQVLNGERLPMPDQQFDSVVSTWTLCSIAQVEQALREIDRVLKPGGKFLFIEHGLSNDPQVQRWQHRLTPIQKVIADGCHLDRNIKHLITQQFSQVTLEEFHDDHLPKIAGYLYKGVATKSA